MKGSIGERVKGEIGERGDGEMKGVVGVEGEVDTETVRVKIERGEGWKKGKRRRKAINSKSAKRGEGEQGRRGSGRERCLGCM